MAKRKPVDMSQYPPNRDDISERIRTRAKNLCEWCGIPNHAVIHRMVKDKYIWISHEEYERLALPDQNLYGKASKIFLTVAHLNHTPMDCRDENLACLCNRCHLNYDAGHHAKNAKQTRIAQKTMKLAAVGQLELFK